MSDSLAKPPDELRADVRKALRSRCFESFTKALTCTAAAAGVSSLFGGGLVALQKFTVGWFATLGMVTLISGILAFFVLEFFRLHERSKLLAQLADSERYVDDLLRAAWTERDVAQDTARRLQSRLDFVMAVREIGSTAAGAISAPEQKALPAQAPAQGEENA